MSEPISQPARDAARAMAIHRKEVDIVKVIRAGCFILVALLVLYPVFWLALGSMQASPRAIGFSLDAYIRVFTSPYLGEVVWNTAVMSIGTTILTVIMGVPLAWIVARTDTPMKPLLNLLALVPFITAPILGGIAWAYLGGPGAGVINVLWRMVTGLDTPLFDIYGMGGLIFVMSLYLTPYVFIFTSIALEHMDPALENAAYISGSSPIKTTLTVTLPLMLPAILSGALLVFIQSLEIFAIPAAIATPGGIYVFVTQVYQLLLGMPPRYADAAVLSMPVLIVCAFALIMQIKALGKNKSYVTVGGKSSRLRRLKLGKWRYVTLAYALLYLFMAAGLPYLIFLYGAFIRTSGVPPTWDNLTLRFVIEFLTGSGAELLRRSMMNSLYLSVTGASAAVVLGAFAAYFITRGKWRGQRTLDFLSIMPLAIPGAVLAIGLLWAYLRPPFELYGTLMILFLAYVTRYLPFGVKTINTSLVQVSEDIEKGARISGASWITMFRTVLVPILIPGIFAGWVIMYVSMMRELSASILLFTSRTEVLAVALYLLWDEARFQMVSILSLVIIFLTLVPIALMRWLLRNSYTKVET